MSYYGNDNTIRNFLIGCSLVAVPALVGLTCSVRTGDSHEDGSSVGTLINVREEGVLWPRPAATLLHSGEMKGDEFAIENDPDLLAKARKFADEAARVKVTYISRYVCWAWNYASCTIITGIEPDPAEK